MTNQELNELINVIQAQYPLFTCKLQKDGWVRVDVYVGQIWVKELDTRTTFQLNMEHRRLQAKVDFMSKYPNLYPYISHDCSVSSLWVNNGGRSGDAIPHNIPLKETELPHWNEEAGKARQKGWFLCFLCGKAKPRSEYGYYHFTAEYCRECLDKHPDVERSAKNESYN